MGTAIFVVLVIVLVVLFLPVNTDRYNTESAYLTGYNEAVKTIKEGGYPQQMLDQAKSSLTKDMWDRGWMQACRDYGANG